MNPLQHCLSHLSNFIGFILALYCANFKLSGLVKAREEVGEEHLEVKKTTLDATNKSES